MIDERWNLNLLPPKGHSDVAEFAMLLFDIARLEKDRLQKPQDFLANYSLYRGKNNQQFTTGKIGFSQKKKIKNLVNLYFANIERTVSNITARNPTGEVVDLDGINDGSENVLSMQLKKWWKETDQQTKTRASARQMEIYGITLEKPYWDKDRDRPDISLTDPFAFFPAPGNWEKIDEEAPYICFAYVDFISNIEATFNVKNVAHDEAYDLMGAEREDYKSQGINQTIGNYSDPVTVKKQAESGHKSIQRGLVIEVWVRDGRTRSETLKQPATDEAGAPILDKDGNALLVDVSQVVKVYPDGIRKITITRSKDLNVKSGVIVLDDTANPNINPALPVEQASLTHPWGRLPAYYANSYKDGVSIWGFAAAEQVGDLLEKIGIIVQKLIAYVINVMAPPLIISRNSGITQTMIENNIERGGRLLLMPTTPTARIEFMAIPNLPETFFRVLDLLVRFFDRIYQIEDADRGEAPRGIIAASAIVALQERNQVMMQTKISAIDFLSEQRSKWAVGLWQNFGTAADTVSVDGETIPFRGVQYAGRKFNYVVESGSTTPRTSLQVEEQAINYFKLRAIDARALLETTNFPNWKKIIERTGETQLDMALQVLIQAGLPEEQAIGLKQILMQPQGGPGDTQQSTPQPGIPKAQQG